MGFHRKHPGLNHIAFQAVSSKDVDQVAGFLQRQNIPILYSPRNFDEDGLYYALFFEDPFRLKLEVVYSPDYFPRSL
jgi:hypothetical protein